LTDVLLLVGRSLRNAIRVPAAIIPSIAISVFFLFVYDAGLSSVAELPGFQGTYLGFILPVAIVSAAVGGAGLAGQTLIKDIDNGYFTKLLLTPTRRLSVIWGPMIASAIVLTAQVVLVMVIALFMGLKVATGPAGFALVVVLAFLWGMAFAGYAAFMALKTKNAAAAQAATFAFFPLIFLSYTFVPEEYVTTTWLRVAATINPTTYVFDSMRSLLNTGWDATSLLVGFGVTFGFATVTGIMALWAARGATKMS
jgi:ABC-2 type transport system permease protein